MDERFMVGKKVAAGLAAVILAGSVAPAAIADELGIDPGAQVAVAEPPAVAEFPAETGEGAPSTDATTTDVQTETPAPEVPAVSTDDVPAIDETGAGEGAADVSQDGAAVVGEAQTTGDDVEGAENQTAQDVQAEFAASGGDEAQGQDAAPSDSDDAAGNAGVSTDMAMDDVDATPAEADADATSDSPLLGAASIDQPAPLLASGGATSDASAADAPTYTGIGYGVSANPSDGGKASMIIKFLDGTTKEVTNLAELSDDELSKSVSTIVFRAVANADYKFKDWTSYIAHSEWFDSDQVAGQTIVFCPMYIVTPDGEFTSRYGSSPTDEWKAMYNIDTSEIADFDASGIPYEEITYEYGGSLFWTVSSNEFDWVMVANFEKTGEEEQKEQQEQTEPDVTPQPSPVVEPSYTPAVPPLVKTADESASAWPFAAAGAAALVAGAVAGVRSRKEA